VKKATCLLIALTVRSLLEVMCETLRESIIMVEDFQTESQPILNAKMYVSF
jgi:hypothetical protein